MKDVEKLFIFADNTIEETIKVIERGGMGIALLVDDERHLIGTITDGDIRRAILRKISLDSVVSEIIKDPLVRDTKITVDRVGASSEEILRIMKENVLRHIPLLDEEGRVVELIWISELIEEDPREIISAVIMAGGKGQRLHPLTNNIPKPMLPLKGSPLMERMIEQLRKSGVVKIHISTHYKPEVIINHFGNGDNFGVDIGYINEDQPLGTAGALGLMEKITTTSLVINGDIVTQLDFRMMSDFHRFHKGVMTIGVRKCEFEIPYGVVENHDVIVKKIVEKPMQTIIVNAGIYLLEPVVYGYIPKNRRFDMTDLANQLIEAGHKVICFPIQEYWLDIGHFENYEQIKEDAKNGKI